MYPETKPDLWFNKDGVCSACLNYQDRSNIDWSERKEEFLHIIEKYRNCNLNYDCIVPVSGGKDSTYQVIRLLELGLNPLCITAETDSMSNLGRKNLNNLKNLGVDHIHVTPNPIVRKKIARLTLEKIGDIQWAEHVTIFTIPCRIAIEKRIPLIIWGENPQNEYGGPASAIKNNILDRRWLEEFGGLLGLRVSDLLSQAGVQHKDLLPYIYPDDNSLKNVGVIGLYLGYYFPWDGYSNALYSQANGFETYPIAVEGNLVNYENLDNYYHGIHDYFKYLKYGFGRATDQVNNHIRRNRLSRSDAIKLIKKIDGKFPWTYLGRKITDILSEIDMQIDTFIKLCDRFTNKKIFLCNEDNQLIKDSNGNLTKLNYENVDELVTI